MNCARFRVRGLSACALSIIAAIPNAALAQSTALRLPEQTSAPAVDQSPAQAADNIPPALGKTQTPSSGPPPVRSGVSVPVVPAVPIPGGHLAPPGQPQALRWLEDWSYLSDTSKRRGPLEALRYIPLGNDPSYYLSIGGEVRYNLQHFSSVTLRSVANDKLTNFQQRLRLVGDLHLGTHVRAFVELGDDRELASDFPTVVNRDHVDLTQAFVDITVPLGTNLTATLRPGRFEMPVGLSKLIALRDARSVRFLFQGVRGTLIDKGKFYVDAFAVKPVQIVPGAFDDKTQDGFTLNGVYVSSARSAVIPNATVAAYYFDQHRDVARFTTLLGAEDRRSWGALVSGRANAFDYSAEGTYQSGRFAGSRIRAYAAFLEAGYTIPVSAWKPRLGTRVNVVSGDTKAGDGKIGTFSAPFGQVPIYTDSAWFAFSNLVDVYPSLTIKPTPRISISAGPDVFWRYSAQDSVYFAPSTFPSVTPRGGQRYVGTAYNLQTDILATKNVSIHGQYTHFDQSTSFDSGGGLNGNFFELWVDLRF